MKFLSRVMAVIALVFAGAFALTNPSFAQVYPTSTPVYIPNAVLSPVTLTTTGDYYFNSNGVGAASVRVAGLSGTLVAVIQGSNDSYAIANGSASWTTLQFIPVGGGAVATSISDNAFVFFNSGGLTRFRVHVSTLTGGSHTVTLSASATPGSNGIYVMNPQAISGPVGIVDSGGVNNLSVGTNGGALTNSASDYPLGAVPITVSATGTTGAVTGALAHGSLTTTYICGFSIQTSANAATVVAPTITGVVTATMTFSQYVAVNTAGVSDLSKSFTRCLPASGTDTGISVISGAAGTGGVTAVTAWGYEL